MNATEQAVVGVQTIAGYGAPVFWMGGGARPPPRGVRILACGPLEHSGRGEGREMSYLSIGLLSLLWCVFAASSWSKIRSRAALSAFADSLRPLPLLRARLVDPVALVVTAAEVALVLGIGWSMVATAAGWSTAGGGATLTLVLAGLLLAVLTTGVVLAVRRRTGAAVPGRAAPASGRPSGR